MAGTTNPPSLKGNFMSKEINYILEYRENGEKKNIEIKIDFISRGISRDFESLNKKQNELRKKWDDVLENEYLISDLKKEKPEGYKIKIKELDLLNETLQKEILGFNKDEFIEQQHYLIQSILKDNGIKNQMLLSSDFWERKVDVQDMMTFIVAVIYKDIDLKKKH
jgi:hypothetical protein